MEKVFEFLKETGTYYLATAENGQPRVRPFGTINLYNGRLYIQSGKSKSVAHQLRLNGKAEICAFDGSKWLRVECELVEDDDVLARKSMLDAYPELRRMYDENDGNTVVYYMKNAKAVFSSFTEAPEIIKF